MNTHPSESLPAYVLGALDADEASQIAEHLRVCPSCRAETEEFRTVVGTLPYCIPAQDPPPHVKRQLFARISAAPEARARPAAARPGFRLPRLFATPRWMAALTAVSVVLAFVMGAMMVSARYSTAREEQAIAEFLSSPRTVSQDLTTAAPDASGKMFMQPGHNRVVLVVDGLPPPAPGTAYQFWFATEAEQVPSSVFSVGDDGSAELVIDAPAQVDTYQEVMITVEQSGGSQQPSTQVVMAATLSQG